MGGDVNTSIDCLSISAYFWADSLLAAENGQINEMQRSVECAQINQSAVDTRDCCPAPFHPYTPIPSP